MKNPFKKKIVNNFPNLGKDINIQVEEPQKTLNRVNKNDGLQGI
jgi:hypothetical protein